MVIACMATAAFYLRFLIAIWKERQCLPIVYWVRLWLTSATSDASKPGCMNRYPNSGSVNGSFGESNNRHGQIQLVGRMHTRLTFPAVARLAPRNEHVHQWTSRQPECRTRSYWRSVVVLRLFWAWPISTSAQETASQYHSAPTETAQQLQERVTALESEVSVLMAVMKQYVGKPEWIDRGDSTPLICR